MTDIINPDNIRIKILDRLICNGDLMWALIPDPGYKSVDGRDLSLDVINSMRVSKIYIFFEINPKIIS